MTIEVSTQKGRKRIKSDKIEEPLTLTILKRLRNRVQSVQTPYHKFSQKQTFMPSPTEKRYNWKNQRKLVKWIFEGKGTTT